MMQWRIAQGENYWDRINLRKNLPKTGSGYPYPGFRSWNANQDMASKLHLGTDKKMARNIVHRQD
jgi:hypothetical protein